MGKMGKSQEQQDLENELRIIRNFKNTHEHKCKYCGKAITERDDLTVDHVVPRSKDGITTNKNLVICCYGCNQSKGRIDVERFINCKIKEQFNKENYANRKCKKIGRMHNLDNNNVYHLAMHDSNVWDINAFFGKNIVV